ncbi:hypothetical protein J3Q64DRAFT_1836753 [Phycomyces blakesleeanus]|uniref:Uncharacterized protein n=1 Tax=Phycomyces blakesleeanus TaxID=4837 RepID=A0ABR3AUP2_PHYBL
MSSVLARKKCFKGILVCLLAPPSFKPIYAYTSSGGVQNFEYEAEGFKDIILELEDVGLKALCPSFLFDDWLVVLHFADSEAQEQDVKHQSTLQGGNNMDGSEVMHRLWNRDLAAVLNFRHILNNLRYDGIIPVRFTHVIRIGRIRRQAEEDLQEGRRLRQRLTRIQRR